MFSAAQKHLTYYTYRPKKMLLSKLATSKQNRKNNSLND